MVNPSLIPQIDPSKMASVVAASSDTKWNLHFFVMVYSSSQLKIMFIFLTVFPTSGAVPVLHKIDDFSFVVSGIAIYALLCFCYIIFLVNFGILTFP